MYLYSSSASEFIKQAVSSVFFKNLHETSLKKFRSANVREYISWQNSLRTLALFLSQYGFSDQGIIIEYKLPTSKRRIDFLMTGLDTLGKPTAVIIELKQWDNLYQHFGPAEGSGNMTIKGEVKRHPSYQAQTYEDELKANYPIFKRGDIQLRSCAFMHNIVRDESNELYSPRHKSGLEQSPIFTGNEIEEFADFLRSLVGGGCGQDVLDKIFCSEHVRPLHLTRHLADIVNGHKEFVLVGNQLAAYEEILAKVWNVAHGPFQKRVFIIRGGPGTGKTVIALHLLAALARMEKQVWFLSGSRAFHGSLLSQLGDKAEEFFYYYMINLHDNHKLNHFDSLIIDEAHRLRPFSYNRYKNIKNPKPQTEDLMDIARVPVFLLDNLQKFRRDDVGSSQLIKKTAEAKGYKWIEFNLDDQFRCNGNDAYTDWVDDVLGVSKGDSVWNQNGSYDFKIVDSPDELQRTVLSLNSEDSTARVVAGFCWPWSKTQERELVNDVQIGDWSMPWNADHQKKGKPKGDIPDLGDWAIHPNGVNQVGCVYTVQNMELDHVGLIFGDDLRYDWDKGCWAGDSRKSYDRMVKSKDAYLERAQAIYRILLTRGIYSCHVYFVNPDTRRYFESRINKI